MECREIIKGYDKDYTILELKNILINYDYIKNRNENNHYKNITNYDEQLGEKFIKYPKNLKFEVSNFGRIKTNNTIQPQEEEELGYLKVKSTLVYRFVAETWLNCPIDEINKDARWEVHHITNNGRDNRPENLIWVTQKEHSIIDPNPRKRKEKLKIDFYDLLDEYINCEDVENIKEIFTDVVLIGNRDVEKDKEQIKTYISRIKQIKKIDIKEFNLDTLLLKKWKIEI